MHGAILLLPLLHGGAGVAERRAEAGGELGPPEVERGEGRLRQRRCSGVAFAVGGGDEASCPARAPSPAEQEAEEASLEAELAAELSELGAARE